MMQYSFFYQNAEENLCVWMTPANSEAQAWDLYLADHTETVYCILRTNDLPEVLLLE